MKKTIPAVFLTLCLFVFLNPVQGKDYTLTSPDKKIVLTVSVGKDISCSIEDLSGVLVKELSPGLLLGDFVLGKNPKVRSAKIVEMDEELSPVVPTISSLIRDNYRQLTLQFRGDYTLVFRAYNNGVAYRFETSLPGEVKVGDEEMNLEFPADFTCYFPREESLISHYERSYEVQPVEKIEAGGFCSLPVLFKSPQGSSVLFTEADLFDYPCMFLEKGEKDGFSSLFPGVVLKAVQKGESDRDQEITSADDHITVTAGSRTWPWRVFMIAASDGELLTNDLVYQLSRPLQLEETGWIKPGLVAWDWWNALNIEGVDFESGINNQTYKYYIDFASEYGLDYIILDEGWTKSTTNILACNPDINVEELVRYGKEKKVGVILWVLWKPLEDKLTEVLDLYQKWGVKGIKVDFMQRADQNMVNYYERVARETAAREMLVDFHGAFKPSGLRRAFPNVISYEGVKGLENAKWSRDINPEHDLTIPFIRMAAGPMDFTPGAMDNAHDINFVPRFTRPMSMGTRCHQLAMYIIYISPLQMLSDTPTKYYRERECTEFISGIPTTWDETVVLEAAVSDHIVLARRKGESWYVGAMCDGTEKEFEIDLSFLGDENYKAEIMEDGSNASKLATDFTRRTAVVRKGEKVKISMARGGGWAAKFTPAL